MLLILIFEFHKMEFVSQEIQKDPKHLHLRKIFTQLLYVYIAIQNFSAEVLLQFYIALYLSKHFWIYCHLPLACFRTFWYLF